METFEGAKIWWTHAVHGFKTSDGSSQDHRSYTLKIHKRDRDRIIPAYLDEIRENAYNFMFKNRYCRSRGISNTTCFQNANAGFAMEPKLMPWIPSFKLHVVNP